MERRVKTAYLLSMKREMFWKFELALVLAALPLAGGCIQQNAESAPVTQAANNDESVADLTVSTNAPLPEAAENDLETAPGRLVSSATAPQVSGSAAEVARLAQAGVDESVMMSYVTNSSRVFDLSADDIVYLNDIGVPSAVVTAMIQHDQKIQGTTGESATAAVPELNVNTTAQAEIASESTPGTVEETQPVEAPLVPENAPEGNAAYSYFYDSLAPYGSWVDVQGYGMCWRPTVTVVNPGWQPYSDNGYWVNSDSGWYWASDYTWGWAPFHYGRWFHHRNWGWCWAPDTVWGPAWVSWRYTDAYCGWAPLPPTACYAPGVGFTYFGHPVGVSFGFGIGWSSFSFVSINNFCDRHWYHHRIPPHEVHGFYNHTVIKNKVVVHNKTIINEGIPVTRVAAAAHSEIPQHHIRDAGDPRSARFQGGRNSDRSLAVYRPNLPAPTKKSNFVGQGVKLDERAVQRIRSDERISGNERISRSPSVEGSPKSPFDSRTSISRDQLNDRMPNAENRRTVLPKNEARDNNSVRNNAPAVSRTEKPGSIILRGPDRNRDGDNKQNPPNSLILRGNRDDARLSRSQPTQPVPQPVPSVQDNRNRNDSRTARNLDRPSYSAPMPQREPVVTAPLTPQTRDQGKNRFDREDNRVFRQEQRQFSQPDSQPRWQPPVQTYQAPQIAPREEPRWNRQQGDNAAPVVRSGSSQPRQESRQEPAPAKQHGGDGGGGGNSRNDRQDGGGRGR